MKGPAIYGVIAEFPRQAPILMESEGQFSSREAAFKRANEIYGAIRYAVVRLEYEGGNELLLHDMERMQKPTEDEPSF